MDCDSPILYIVRASTVEMSPKRKNTICFAQVLNQTTGRLLLVKERKTFSSIQKQEALLYMDTLLEALVSVHGMPGDLQWPGQNLWSSLVAKVLCVG